MKRYPLPLLLLCLAHPGCAFFGVERVECLTEEDCLITDAHLDSGGNGGDGDIISSGAANGTGSGPGGETGGRSGGDGGTGGVASGGEGSGGEPGAGGSGGMPVGGTGGVASGGTGGTWLSELERELAINEIHGVFVEIYFRADELSSIALDDFAIVVDGNYAEEDICKLDGAVVSEAEPYLVVQSSSTCLSPSGNCVTECPFDIDLSSLIELAVLVDGSYVAVDDRPHTDTPLDAGQSYGAISDGDEDFVKGPISAGEAN